MSKRIKQIIQKNNQGANVVEFALVLIILALLIAGIADLGRAFHSYIVITNASREGARLGARVEHSDDIDDWIIEAVVREAANSGVDLEEEGVANITIEPPNNEELRLAGKPITVTVEYTISMFLSSFVGIDQLPMRTQTVMMMYASEDVTGTP